MTSFDLLACHDCDALHRTRSLSAGQSALCHRCGAVLYREQPLDLDRPLAFSLTGLILFVLANHYPLLSLELGGRIQESSLFSGVTALFHEGLWFLSALVFCTSLLFPFLTLLATIYLLLPLKLGGRPLWQAARVFRVLLIVTPWEMTGVYLLGVIVAIVKLRDLASVEAGIALYAYIGLLLSSLAATLTLEPRTLWKYLE